MHFYFGTNGDLPQTEALNARRARRLLSYALVISDFSWGGRENIATYLKSVVAHDLELMFDSGAFSAHSRGIAIRLEDYADFILTNPGAFEVVVNLDKIPGAPGTGLNHDPNEAERAAAESWQNWLDLCAALKPAGITPVPVYHRGEDIKWLKRLIDNAEYIGLGGARHGTTPDKIRWLDSLMPYLTDDKGYPIRKFHGFAATSTEIMERYPWASVDSTSWVQTGNFGAVMIPRDILGRREQKIVFSDDVRALHNHSAVHFRSLADVARAPVVQYLARHGMTPRMLAENFCLTCGGNPSCSTRPATFQDRLGACCSDAKPSIAYMQRHALNIEYVLDFERRYEPRPWKRDTR